MLVYNKKRDRSKFSDLAVGDTFKFDDASGDANIYMKGKSVDGAEYSIGLHNGLVFRAISNPFITLVDGYFQES